MPTLTENPNVESHRVCRRCGAHRPLAEFPRAHRKGSPHRRTCVLCVVPRRQDGACASSRERQLLNVVVALATMLKGER